MRHRFHPFALLLLFIAGCAGQTAQEKYDIAVKDLDRAQARLDRLRPAYDAAKITAMNAVCKEIAGTTPEESATQVLAGLGQAMTETTASPPADAKVPAPGEKPVGKKKDELDTVVDNFEATAKAVHEKQASLSAPLAKANEVMSKIKTPGTPEAKKMEEKLKAMPEAQAYERQQERVDKAQATVDEAQAELK